MTKAERKKAKKILKNLKLGLRLKLKPNKRHASKKDYKRKKKVDYEDECD